MDALVKASINYFTLEGERIQNCQNEDEALDVTYSCAKIRDKMTVIWELAPIEPRVEYGSRTPPGRAPLRLVLVVDVSHSMAEPYGPDTEVSKLEKIKMFAQLLVGNMPEEDHLGIVAFGTKAHVIFPVAKMDQEARDEAMKSLEKIKVSGVTNLGAGLCTAIDQFHTLYSKTRYLNDNILLFTDGMANEGLTETDDMVRELRKRIGLIRHECKFAEDYSVKLCTVGTGGFLPELLFNIGQVFSSDAFYFMDEVTSLELNLMKPVLLRDSALVTAVTVCLRTHNGVTLDKSAMTNEYEPYDPDSDEILDETKADYFIHDIATDMRRHLYCVLKLPPKHKKVLKNKEVMTVAVRYRDRNMLIRTVEKRIHYAELRLKGHAEEKDVVIAAEHETRIQAQKSLDKSAAFMQHLDRVHARDALLNGAGHIRDLCEHVSTLVGEETIEFVFHKADPILRNLEYCEGQLADMSVRWDDAWARLKAISSSLGREVPTASGVYADGAELFSPQHLDEQMEGIINRLRDIYVALGLSTDMIDKYKTVMSELQRKLEALEEDGGDFKESRI